MEFRNKREHLSSGASNAIPTHFVFERISTCGKKSFVSQLDASQGICVEIVHI